MGTKVLIAVAVAAVGLAAVAGWCAWQVYGRWRSRARARRAVREMGHQDHAGFWGLSGAAEMLEGDDAVARLIAFAVALDHRARGVSFRWLAPSSIRCRPVDERRWMAAGLAGRVSAPVVWEARIRLAMGFGLCGGLLGFCFSTELGLAMAGAAAVVGWRALPWAVEQRARSRAEEMERHLSEMLDVMALGLRSGLSFDRSLELYLEHFESLLASSFARAQQQWTRGLASRSQALRHVAASYRSPLLERVVENIIRSLRFGSTLADNLEDAAREARRGYQARKQEQVAKAPVKMMVPTGVLILPAMLLLVLGPVLLELAGGF